MRHCIDDYDEDSERKRKREREEAGRRRKYEILGSVLFAIVFGLRLILKYAPELFEAENWDKEEPEISGNSDMFVGLPQNGSIYDSAEDAECTYYEEYLYDDAGLLVQRNIYGPHEYYEDTFAWSAKGVWKYDTEGRPILFEDYYSVLSENAEPTSRIVYEYTAKGMTEKEERYGKDDCRVYDEWGNLIEEKLSTRYRYPIEYTYTYDARNRRLSETEKDGDGQESCIWRMEYNDAENTGEAVGYEADGSEYRRWLDSYDEEGRRTNSIWWEPSEKSTWSQGYHAVYENDLLWEEAAVKKDYDTEYAYYRVYDYDTNGNHILTISYFADAIAISYYTYDGENRKIGYFAYEIEREKGWEQKLSDGSSLTVMPEDEEKVVFTRTSEENALLSRVVCDEDGAPLTWETPEEIISWMERTEEQEAEKPVTRFCYVVQPGDSLWSIAEKYLGSGADYLKIYWENRETVGENPALILPGMELYIEMELHLEEEKRDVSDNRDIEKRGR